MDNKFKGIRYFLLLIIVMIIGVIVHGFAAGNNVPGTGAGDGSDTIGGYQIDNFAPASSGALMTQLSFTVDPIDVNTPPASKVSISFDNGATWIICDNNISIDNLFNCIFGLPGIPISSMDSIRVVAVQ